MDKKEIAEKMKKGDCDKCGSHKHKTSEHRKGSMSGGDRGNIIEGDKDDKDLNVFNKKDISKEKATRRAKNSNLEKGGDFET